jgi:SAM-dependent methyltransferase
MPMKLAAKCGVTRAMPRRRATFPFIRPALVLPALVLALAACSRAPSTTRASPPAPSLLDADVALAPLTPPEPASDVYMGRKIAPAMGFGGANWLDRADRERTEAPEKALDALTLARGMVVAGIGAGTGHFTLRIARRIGPEGHVIATDIDKRMLDVLMERAEKAHLSTIEARVATEDDARLSPSSIDLASRVDVYHERSRPAAELTAVRRPLHPDGRTPAREPAYSATTPSTCSPLAVSLPSTRRRQASPSTPAGALSCTRTRPWSDSTTTSAPAIPPAPSSSRTVPLRPSPDHATRRTRAGSSSSRDERATAAGASVASPVPAPAELPNGGASWAVWRATGSRGSPVAIDDVAARFGGRSGSGFVRSAAPGWALGGTPCGSADLLASTARNPGPDPSNIGSFGGAPFSITMPSLPAPSKDAPVFMTAHRPVCAGSCVPRPLFYRANPTILAPCRTRLTPGPPRLGSSLGARRPARIRRAVESAQREGQG